MSKTIVLLSKTIITNQTPIKELLDTLLDNRHIQNKSDFLAPKKILASPENFGINPEVFQSFIKHLELLLKQKKRILIYGDYDADGITSTAQLYLALSQHNPNILPYIPHRQRDGYGLKAKAVFNLSKTKSWNPDVILTTDNGISAKEEIAILTSHGFEVMVIDHHMSGQATPDIQFILHSTGTSASALSWLVSSQFLPNFSEDLATIGVIADCIPLVGPNRNLVYFGQKALAKSTLPGLQALISQSGLENKSITTTDISFVLAPRINASGRLDDGMDSLRLLCAPNSTLAKAFSSKLNQQNTNRQQLQQESYLQIEDKINQQDYLFFVHDNAFHPGLIGLLSGKLTEKYYRPSVVTTQVDGIIKGSCRSIPEFHITHALEQLRHLCLDLGGHAQAAGFSLKPENLNEFRVKLQQIAKTQLFGQDLTPKIHIDAQMELPALTTTLVQALQDLAPFGIGNPEPLFYFSNLTIKARYIIGSQNQHLKFIFSPNIQGLVFSAEKSYFDLVVGDTVSIVAKLDINNYNNISVVQLLIKYMDVDRK